MAQESRRSRCRTVAAFRGQPALVLEPYLHRPSPRVLWRSRPARYAARRPIRRATGGSWRACCAVDVARHACGEPRSRGQAAALRQLPVPLKHLGPAVGVATLTLSPPDSAVTVAESRESPLDAAQETLSCLPLDEDGHEVTNGCAVQLIMCLVNDCGNARPSGLGELRREPRGDVIDGATLVFRSGHICSVGWDCPPDQVN